MVFRIVKVKLLPFFRMSPTNLELTFITMEFFEKMLSVLRLLKFNLIRNESI